jgi:hypothetical protein
VREVGFLQKKYIGGTAKSVALTPLLKTLAKKHGAAFLDASAHIEVSDTDGVHYSPEMHAKLADAVIRSLNA